MVTKTVRLKKFSSFFLSWKETCEDSLDFFEARANMDTLKFTVIGGEKYENEIYC